MAGLEREGGWAAFDGEPRTELVGYHPPAVSASSVCSRGHACPTCGQNIKPAFNQNANQPGEERWGGVGGEREFPLIIVHLRCVFVFCFIDF